MANRFNAAARQRHCKVQVKCSNRYAAFAQDNTGETQSEWPSVRQSLLEKYLRGVACPDQHNAQNKETGTHDGIVSCSNLGGDDESVTERRE